MKKANQKLIAYNASFVGRKVIKSNNSILVIHPYYKSGLWVFDDERTGLDAEPFVAGADDLIDYLLRKKRIRTKAKTGFNAIFAKQEFRGVDAELTFKKFAQMGSVYIPEGLKDFKNSDGSREVWLCPALNLYFKNSPEKIFVGIKL